MSKVGKIWKAVEVYEPLASEEKINQLEDELKQLLDNISKEEVAVGDAMMVEYDREWAEEHGVGRFGRMTLKNGEKKFHAAPRHMIRENHMSHTRRNFIDYMQSWCDGTSHRPPVDKFLEPVILPEKKKEFKNCTIAYESEIFQRLRIANHITLVNPSMSTLVALKTTGGGSVTLTSGVNEKWSASIHDFVNKSGGLLKMLPKKTVHGIAYLGTNEPLWYPDTGWLRCVINPFVDQTSYFQSIRVDMLPTQIHLTIRKKPEYDVYSILDRDRKVIRYNPESVDAWLAQKRKLLWIESRNPLPIVDIQDRKISHAPWFVAYGGEWQWHENRQWLIQGTKVFDVRETGTYISRRHITPPQGYEWTDFQPVSTHVVTYGCVTPFELNGVNVHQEGKSTIVSFDDTLVSKDLIKRYSKEGAYITDGPGRILNSDEGLRMADHPSDNTLSYAYVDGDGRYFSEKSHSTDGILIKLGGEKYLTPFVAGEVRKLHCFRTPSFTRIVLPPDLAEGHFLAFSGNQSMIDHLEMCTMFTTRYHTVESIVEARADPEYGGFSAQDQTMEKVLDSMKAHEIRRPGDSGLTAAKVALLFGKNPGATYHMLKKMVGVWLWKEGTVSQSQFVHEESVLILFQGGPQAGHYDGMEWRNILHKLTILPQQGRMTFPFSPGVPLKLFQSFVELNGYLCKIVRFQAVTHLIVTRTFF
jgi:hypothetical protein